MAEHPRNKLRTHEHTLPGGHRTRHHNPHRRIPLPGDRRRTESKHRRHPHHRQRKQPLRSERLLRIHLHTRQHKQKRATKMGKLLSHQIRSHPARHIYRQPTRHPLEQPHRQPLQRRHSRHRQRRHLPLGTKSEQNLQRQPDHRTTKPVSRQRIRTMGTRRRREHPC